MIDTIQPVRSAASFLEAVTSIRREWSPGDRWVDPWFRGQSDSAWSLVPGRYRLKEADEDELRDEFQRRAEPLMLTERTPTNSWEWYFLMQHYGVPTRLLDWTEGALIALYFAVRSTRGESDAAVWVLDPWWLNSVVIGREDVLQARNQEVRDYLPEVFSERRLPVLPIAINPPHVLRRMSAQHSTFTIHGSSPDGLSEVGEDDDRRLVKLVIARSAVSDIRKDLATAGIVETTVFPDLEGLGRELRSNWTRELLPETTR